MLSPQVTYTINHWTITFVWWNSKNCTSGLAIHVILRYHPSHFIVWQCLLFPLRFSGTAATWNVFRWLLMLPTYRITLYWNRPQIWRKSVFYLLGRGALYWRHFTSAQTMATLAPIDFELQWIISSTSQSHLRFHHENEELDLFPTKSRLCQTGIFPWWSSQSNSTSSPQLPVVHKTREMRIKFHFGSESCLLPFVKIFCSKCKNYLTIIRWNGS